MLDLRQAIRGFRATPVVSAVAVLSLALGIGATTAVFSIVNGLLLRPLAVEHPDRLVTVTTDTAIKLGFKAGGGWNYVMWERLQARAGAFDGAFAFRPAQFNLGAGGEARPVDGLYASGGLFSTLGLRALQGRLFTPADDVKGGGADGPVVVISHALWQRRFGGAPGAIGSRLVVDGVPVTIVGVAPPAFTGLEVGQSADVMLPLDTEPLLRGGNSALAQPRNYSLLVVLRLKPGQSVEAGTAAIRALQPEIVPANAPGFVREPFTLARAAEGTGDGLRQRYTQPLLTILAIAGLVLLVACANIANLLLARAAARRHEIAVRVALGASRWRIARQLLVESLVLAALGTGLGLVFAAWGSRALVAQLATSASTVVLDLSTDWRVAAFAAALTVATAVLFGLAPAVGATRTDPAGTLRLTARSDGRGRGGLSSALVVAQVSLSLVLVVTAGLLVRTFERLARNPLGFDSGRLLVVTVDATRAAVDPAARLLFYQRLVDAAATVPGVERSAGSVWAPLGSGGFQLQLDVPGAPQTGERRAVGNFVTPGWFAAYGIPLRDGRDFTGLDTAGAAPVVIVNESLVRRFFPGRNAIGETVPIGADGGGPPGRTIVGVVKDAVFRSTRVVPGAASLPLRDPVPPIVYVPLAQSAGLRPPGSATINLSVRSASGAPAALAGGIGRQLSAVDPALAFTFRPLDDLVSGTLVQERMSAMVSGFFGALGLLLASLGLYGVTWYGVTLRRTEIGIRLALGAAPLGIVRLVLARIGLVVGIGLAIGTCVCLWTSTLLASLLYGVAPRDPATLMIAAVVLAGLALLAGWLPARRASRIDPAIVLRSE
jgi:putative ABC transport system permease protein